MRVLEAYSPKLLRRLHCFGEHVFAQWIRLEADPTVREFCERPAYPDHAGKHLVEYWLLQEDRKALLIVDGENQPLRSRLAAQNCMFAAFRQTNLRLNKKARIAITRLRFSHYSYF